MQSITPAQLPQWLEQIRQERPDGTLPLVLDVREPWELQTASVRPDGFELLHKPYSAEQLGRILNRALAVRSDAVGRPVEP